MPEWAYAFDELDEYRKTVEDYLGEQLGPVLRDDPEPFFVHLIECFDNALDVVTCALAWQTKST